MNLKSVRKQPIVTALGHSHTKKKLKSKSRSKQKTQELFPKEFLDALIDLQNTNCSTYKKKKNTARDITSALTIATPLLDKSIDPHKFRSKSSLSQHRRKGGGKGLPLPMCIDLGAVFTEEDYIQYTQKSTSQDDGPQQPKLQVKSQKSKNVNIYAIKIQRAWRNYQTYKMVHRVYLQERKESEVAKEYEARVHHLQVKIRKKDHENILRIKKDQNPELLAKKQMQQKLQQQPSGRIDPSSVPDRERTAVPCEFAGTGGSQKYPQKCPEKCANLRTVKEVKQNQATRFSEVINLIQKTSSAKSKESLLNDLMLKFQENKKNLEKDISKQLSLEVSKGKQTVPIFETNEKQEQKPSQPTAQKSTKSPDNDGTPQGGLEQAGNSQSPSGYERLNINDFVSSEEDACGAINYETIITSQMAQFKVFDERLQMIKEERLKKLEKIDYALFDNKISNQEATHKKQLIYLKYEKEKKIIEKHKKRLVFSFSQLKKNAIEFQKLNHNLSHSKLRKSISVGNTVIKQILEDIKIVQITRQSSEKFFVLKNQSQKNQEIEIQKSTDEKLVNPPLALSNEKELENKNRNSTEIIKEHCEQIQSLIEKELIQEFVRTVFLEQNIFNNFRPYIEEIYEFKKIPDEDVATFFSVIVQLLPEQSQMIKRTNQKINPTTPQILRIIRDFDFEIDEYQLIIPEETFKRHRAQIEQSYEEINRKAEPDRQSIMANVKSEALAAKIYFLELEKQDKMRKYRNFERDLKIMYMKSVFNCINEYLIELKSSNAFMNGRSSIGPGQLTLALKQYNQVYDQQKYHKLLNQVDAKIVGLVNKKCMIPSFHNQKDVQLFQGQVMGQIRIQSAESQFKWVNYMDQVLEIWQDLANHMVQVLMKEVCCDILSIFR